MTAAGQSAPDITARQKQLQGLYQNLNILREREAKYGGSAPLELVNQIDDHQQAIALIEQALAGQLSGEELEEALKPLLLALHNGQVVNITAETYVAGDQLIQNITQIAERALTAAEAAEKARSLALQRLAQGVRDYALRLQAIATDETDTAGGNPYKGLQVYRLGDAELFFGRDAAIAELLPRLRNPLTILHAVSGAGKSSLLQAGISPRLLAQGHLPVYLRPYNQSPIQAIKSVFLPNLADVPELAQASLRDFLHQVTGVLGQDATLYLLLDQFEEIFTLADETTRQAFVGEMAGCLEDESLNVRWVLSLRTEFFGEIANFRPHLRNPFENDYRLNRLNRAEAATVITTPAERQSFTFEPLLVEELLADLRDPDSDELSPAQLQLVCSALYNFFRERQTAVPSLAPTITLQMYQAEGEAQGILRNHLNRVLSRIMGKPKREAARQLLMALVSSDQHRLRRTKSDLAAALGVYLTHPQVLDELLDQLIENRLLNVEKDEQTDEPSYELAHDYLLTEIRLDPVTQARKAAEEMLHQEVVAYKRYGTLLSPEEFAIVNSQRNFLHLDGDVAELLRRSQAAHRRTQLQWYGLVAGAVLLIIGAVIAIAVIQARSADQQAMAAATAQAGATQARLAEATAEAEAVRAINAQSTAQAESERAKLAESRTRIQFNQTTLAQATAQAEKEIAEVNAAEAQRQARVANARQLAGQVRNLGVTNPPQALLLALEAQNIFSTTEGAMAVANLTYSYPPLKATLLRHTDAVNGVAWSPDGRYLASASTDTTVIIWDTATGQPKSTLTGHEDTVVGVAWSPDGRRLASSSADGNLIIWDTATGQPITTLTGHTDEVITVAWSPDGRQIASGSNDNSIILWDADTGKATARLLKHTNWVWGVAWSPDSKRLASASFDQTAIIWDVATGKPVITLRGHQDRLNSVTWSPDGKRLASASTDQTIKIWDTTTGQAITTLTGHESGVITVVWSPDGKRLASGGVGQTVFIWEAATGQLTATLAAHTDWVWGVAWSPDGHTLATGSHDQSILLWDMAAGQPIMTLSGHTNGVNSVAWSPDSRTLASGSGDNSIILWDRATGRLKATLTGHEDWVLDVAWSPDGRQLASSSQDTTVIIWDVARRSPSATLTGHADWVFSVAWNPDGRSLASVSEEGTLIIWDVATGQPTTTLTDVTSEADWSPDGRQLAWPSFDSVVIWDAASGKPVVNLTGHKGAIIDLAWSPDGRQLATASVDKTVIIWDVANSKQITTLTGHSDEVSNVAWSPDGHRLASASFDQSVIVWDIASSQPVIALSDLRVPVYSIAWSPDGRTLAFEGRDKTVKLFSTSFIRPPCQLLSRNLTSQEWDQFLPVDQPYHHTCPNLPLHPSTIEAARDLARDGQVDEAIAQFKHLLTLDPTLDLDPEAEAQQAFKESVQFLLDTAEEQARSGDVEGATATFQEALDLDPSLTLDPQAKAQRLAQPTFENALAEAVDAAKQADEETAQIKFEEAATLADALNSAAVWQTLCDSGTRHGFAETVLPACNKAIEVEPENGLYYNSRGVARLQTGDQAGAQEDFAKFEAWLAENQPGP